MGLGTSSFAAPMWKKGFTPGSLPNLILWIDALTNISAAGGIGAAITAIGDRSPSNNDLIATSPNRPPWGADEFKNSTLPGINFENAGTDFLSTASGSVVPLTAGYSAFIAFNCSTVSAGVAVVNDVPFVMIGQNQGTQVNAFGLNGNNVTYTFGPSNTNAVSSGLNLANGLFHTIGISHSPTGRLSLYADGIQVFSSTSSAFPANSGWSSICEGANSADNFNNGNIAELMICNGALNSTHFATLHVRSTSLWAP
jgi:Concanavalin A-like lectin/glucanases superfamily